MDFVGDDVLTVHANGYNNRIVMATKKKTPT